VRSFLLAIVQRVYKPSAERRRLQGALRISRLDFPGDF